MTVTIVFGVYDFLGLHLSQYLLNEGKEVIGFQWSNQDDDNREEKELLFGRNSNFKFFKEIKEEAFNEAGLIYLNMYDLLRDRFDSFLDIKEEIAKILKRMDNQQVIVLLPDEKREKEISLWIEEIKQSRPTIRWIRIAAELYGIWQNEPCAVQQFVTDKEKEKRMLDLSRLIYIDDFLSTWEMLMKGNQNELVVVGEHDKDYEQQGLRENMIIIQEKTSLSKGLAEIHSYNEKRKF